MNKQPEALRLAGLLESFTVGLPQRNTLKEAAAELRRLHELNAELVEALSDMIDTYQYEASPCNESLLKAKTTLAKATGEKQ